MKSHLLHLMALLLASLLFHSCTSAAELVLVEHGQSDYRIVVPLEATGYELKAASELQEYLEKISGARLPVVEDSEAFTGKEIIIGKNLHLEQIHCQVRFDKLGADGFEIRTKDNCLVIAGGHEKGSLYGVYTFLEKWLGCRHYAPGVFHLPGQSTIVLDKIKERQLPAFAFREMYFPAIYDSTYLLWHKLDRHNHTNWGMWVHTFDDLVPPAEYFDLHPEYFSLVGEKRINNGQLCLSNPEVPGLLSDNLRKKVESRPGVQYWSVSQNDNYLACDCETCRAMDEVYGGPSGTMIHVVNQVARQFPEKTISTLAYQYTRHAPKNVRPEENVNIMLCTIECNRSQPIQVDPSGKAFVKDLKDWSGLTEDILLWDYVVQFRNYISPFPNFHVLQPNIRLFEKYGCEMMFQQGSGRSWSDMSELKSYLIAKLLWNPDADVESIIDDFLMGYYGEAAPYLRQYFDMMHEELHHSESNLWIYGYPVDAANSFLSPVLLEQYNHMFDQAERAVQEQPELLARVKKARLPLQFAILDISLFNYDETLSYFTYEEDKTTVRVEMAEMLDSFVQTCQTEGIENLQEHGTTPEEYREKVGQFILKSLEPSLARGKKVTLLTPCSPKYNPRQEVALTDGLRGISDYHYNWLGFEGEDMVTVIDMGEPIDISHFSAEFFQFTRAWIFLPESVSFSGSLDGIQYKTLGRVSNTVPEVQPGMFSVPFSVDIPVTSLRYVKVETRALKTCPEWHIGAGEKSWIFTDEIVIR